MNLRRLLFVCWILLGCSAVSYSAPNEVPADFDPAMEQQNKINVSGTVVDEQGNPLIGVTVKIKNNYTTATVTDANGHFYIDVPGSGSFLEFSYIGYKPQELRVGDKIFFEIRMEEDVTSLEEVVVTGYGNQRRVSVVGSIETLAPENLQVGSTRSLSNNLAGQVAGIIAVRRSGEPGYDASNFWIRGISTFGTSTRTPLVLVDGIERDLNFIDPAEFESFSVLKDASASAMYGVRGANGVIIITTKRGKIGAPTVNVRVEQSISQPTKLPSFIGAADYMELLNELRQGTSYATYSQDRINKTRYGYDRDLYPDTNWLDEVTKDYAYSTRANLTVSGGSDFLRYALVASYFGEKGIMETDPTLAYDTSQTLDRFNMRANVDIDITKTTTLRMNVGGYLQQRRKPTASVEETLNQAFVTGPFEHPARYSDGIIPMVPNRSNPWAYLTQSGYGRYADSQIQSLFSVEQNLRMVTPGLRAKVTFSFDSYSYSMMERAATAETYNIATGRDINGNLIHGDVSQYGSESLGHKSEGNYGSKNVYLEATLTYNRTFGDVHSLDGLLLYNQQSNDSGATQPYRKQGVSGRASYTYDNRYIAEFNFGYTGSENFAKGNRFGFFPSAAIGWMISEEPFLASARNTLSKLKLRFSVGQAGNDQIGGRRFAYLTTITTGAAGYGWGEFGGTSYSGTIEGEIGVTNLTWETATKYNLGLELSLWNALDFQVDVFQENRKDIFMQRSIIPTQTGFQNNPWANYGKVKNRGIEFSLNFNKNFGKDWSVGFRSNFTYAKNEVIENDEAGSLKGTYRSATGLSMNTLWGLTADRLFTADDFDEYGNLVPGIPIHSVGSTTVRPGDIMYVDRNGDGLVTEEDEGYVGGTVDPRVVYGFGPSIRYKNWDFSAFFQGVGNTYRIIGGSTYFIPGSGQGVRGNVYSNYQDRWTEANPSQDVFWPRLSETSNQHNYRASTWWKKNMSFLRCKTIEVGYSLPERIVNKISLKSVRVYVSANDLFYFSKFKLWDPELDTGNGLRYPGMSSVMVGLDLNF